MYILYSSGNNIWYSIQFILFHRQTLFWIYRANHRFWIYFFLFFFLFGYVFEKPANTGECNVRNKETGQGRLWPRFGYFRKCEIGNSARYFRLLRDRSYGVSSFRAPHRTCNISETGFGKPHCYVGTRVRTCPCALAHLPQGSNRVSVDFCRIRNISENVHWVTE